MVCDTSDQRVGCTPLSRRQRTRCSSARATDSMHAAQGSSGPHPPARARAGLPPLKWLGGCRAAAAGGSAWWTICSRGDQDPSAPDADGCNDAKVTNYSLAMQMGSEAINAPPYGNGLAPFEWGGRWAEFSHRGMPQSMTAEFELQQP
jgi:hypothetical protein